MNWIDNDSKYRDVELDHIETLSEKATSNIWIDAVVIGKVERDVENDEDDDDDDNTENYKVRVTVTENVKDNPCVQVVPICEMRHPVPKSHIVLLIQRRNGIPFSSPLAIRVKSVTGKGLYNLVMDHARKTYIPDWDSSLVKERVPFKLCFVTRNGRSCHRCDWIKACTGCEEISYEDEKMISLSNHTIAIDWNNNVFRKDTPNRYNIKYGQQISTHESVRRLMDSKRTQNTTPDRIEHCLRTFVKPEEIKTYCRRCT